MLHWNDIFNRGKKKHSLNNMLCIWKQKHHVKNLNKEAVDSGSKLAPSMHYLKCCSISTVIKALSQGIPSM